MKPSESESVPSSFFDETYRQSTDPWRYTSSFYETSKFRTTIRSLPKGRFKNAFEIGCAIGVLTKKLAPKCDRLLSVDYSEVGLEEARKRCINLPQVRFEQMQIPQQFRYPVESFILNGDIVHDTFVENSASSLKHLGDPRKKFLMLDAAADGSVDIDELNLLFKLVSIEDFSQWE